MDRKQSLKSSVLISDEFITALRGEVDTSSARDRDMSGSGTASSLHIAVGEEREPNAFQTPRRLSVRLSLQELSRAKSAFLLNRMTFLPTGQSQTGLIEALSYGLLEIESDA